MTKALNVALKSKEPKKCEVIYRETASLKESELVYKSEINK